MVICLWLVSLSCLNMANAAAEHTQLFLQVNLVVHTSLQHHQFLMVLSLLPGHLPPAEWVLLAASNWGCNFLPTVTLPALNWFADFSPRYASPKLQVRWCSHSPASSGGWEDAGSITLLAADTECLVAFTMILHENITPWFYFFKIC